MSILSAPITHITGNIGRSSTRSGTVEMRKLRCRLLHRTFTIVEMGGSAKYQVRMWIPVPRASPMDSLASMRMEVMEVTDVAEPQMVGATVNGYLVLGYVG